MSIGLVCDFALFKHAPLACMRWICLCMAKRFTHERPSALTLPTDDPAWLIQFEFTGKLTHSIQSTFYHTLAKSWGFCPFMSIYLYVGFVVTVAIGCPPLVVGHKSFIYLYVAEKSIHIVDRCFVGRRLYVHFDTVASVMIPTLGGSIMVTRSLFHFVHWRRKDRFVLTKFSSLRCLLVSLWLGNPWSAEAPESDHRHIFCCTTS